MNNENRNEEAVSPVIATILMVAITVVLAGVLYVWAASLADDSKGGGVPKYNFEARDAGPDVTIGGGDDLVYVKMTSADEPLSWSLLKVTMTIANGEDAEQGPSLTCVEADKAESTDQCVWSTSSTKDEWEVSDEITISENTDSDLCNSEDGCEMVITLTKEAVGNDEGGLLRDINGFAE